MERISKGSISTTKKIFKAVRDGDKAKARMSAIRQVTQLNQGKKTARYADGMVFVLKP